MARSVRFRAMTIRRWGGLLAGLLGLAGLTWYMARYWSEFYRLRDLPALGIAALSLIVLTGQLVIAVRLQLIARAFGVVLSLGESCLLAEAGAFLNIVPIGLGTGFRALYLNKVRRLGLVDFGLGFLGSLLCEFVAAGFLGLFFALFVPRTSAVLYVVFLAYILAPVGVLALAWLVRSSSRLRAGARREKQNWADRLVHSLISGLDILFEQPRAVFCWFLLNVVTDLVLGVRYWLVGAWLGYPVDLPSGMVLQSVARATAIVAIMPAGTIGLREAFTGLGAMGLGESAVSGVMISTVDRIVATAWIVSLGSISLFVLRNKIARAVQVERDEGVQVST